ncbi:MAG: NUDIX hydrolase [Bacteroidales bacterium]|nr:NUDIX hydrolase [Bacteroidales bacterium]
MTYFLNRNKKAGDEYKWLKWAIELQFIAQAGITYSKDVFDLERFERLREISAEIMSFKTDKDMAYIKNVFCNETGFQTPKLDTRAAIFKDNKILLVKERDNTWSLPGGWVDVNQSIRSNIIKEVKEEAGLDVFPKRIIAIQDRNMHNTPIFAYGVCKIFILCEIIGGEFNKNIETIESDYFAIDELPLLSVDKNTKEQIEICFKAYKEPDWQVIFD